MSGVVRGIAVAPTVGVERYAVLDDVALADCAVEIEGRDTDDLFETAGMALGAHGRASDGQGVNRAAWWTSTRWKSPASSFRSH
jgi:hypothetical protein